jgi:hypothetical protein
MCVLYAFALSGDVDVGIPMVGSAGVVLDEDSTIALTMLEK